VGGSRPGAASLVRRLRRKARDDADEPLGELVDELELHTRRGVVRLFAVIATLGAPLEVSAANLAIETFLPMDEVSAGRRRDLEPSGLASLIEA
jgi:hypothetical protein